ncbi:MAG: peptide chain release factor N(5)-glutamine methyltransferase [Rhodanobacteraceae bacterium]
MPEAIRGLLIAAQARLSGESVRLESELLLAHALDRPRAWLYAHLDDRPSHASSQHFDALIEARAQGRPVAYLLGQREFWSLPLRITPDVLIPRPETERLVELALARIDAEGGTEVADLGTGSGAIALAIAHTRPQVRVLATDVGATALAVARDNAVRLGLANVAFAEGDWCAALGTRRFDLIVSNPPYIRADDRHLEQGDLRFEPRAALASGDDGLDAIRSIVGAASRHLNPGGWLLLEHGAQQGAAVRTLLVAAGFVNTETACDLAGHERVTCASAKRE